MADVAVTETRKLDAQKLRADFPIFEQLIHGKPLSFLDSAASSQKPRQVLDAMPNVLRDVVRERAPRGLRAGRARDRGLRGRA
jgi:cysteine desulfurase/selenocysteine lyase